jgi:hypothetical protein
MKGEGIFSFFTLARGHIEDAVEATCTYSNLYLYSGLRPWPNRSR